jgi:ribosome-binding factor A
MSTLRQNKVSRLLQKEIGELLQRKSHELFPGSIATVTLVQVSPDLSIAKVYLSLYGKINPEEVMKLLLTKRTELRMELSSQVKHQLRIVPDLRFYIDDSYNDVARIEELLKK